jgi:hypothetical protein
MRDLLEILNSIGSKFYNPSENVAVDKFIVSFKWRVIFKHSFPKSASVSASKFSNVTVSFPLDPYQNVVVFTKDI